LDKNHVDPDDRLAAIRLCVIDVDGTLLTSRHQVSPGTRRAFDAVIAAGIDIMLASSRYPGALARVVEDLGCPSQAFIASQGAILGRYAPDGHLKIIERSPAPLEAARSIVATGRELGLSVSWYSAARWLVQHVDGPIALEAEITGTTPTVADLDREVEAPDKIMLISDPQRRDALRAVAEAVPNGLRADFSNPNYLEITAVGVDKGSTLQRFYRARGLVESQVLAMGDGPNDLGLFSVAGFSVAPANARHDVLAASDLRTGSNDHDGVACVLNLLAKLAR
jgi:Cof subfamily protein (haloacid dehalogenase superfamily)